jgi:hypothetical protein
MEPVIEQKTSAEDVIHEYPKHGGQRIFVFHCPGCGFDHPYHVGGDAAQRPQWTWNGSLTKPTFLPSLVCFKDDPARICHIYVKDGQIQFLMDCAHKLRGQTVPVPIWRD